jgi:CRP-like cAMP-binding protein
LAPQFLERIPPPELSIILQPATLQRFRARSVIANEGQPADRLFLILDGRARTFISTRKGEKIVLIWILPGEISGARALLTKPTEYLVSTETVEDCSALVWKRSAMMSLGRKFPILLENALTIASGYVEISRNLLLEATHHTASQRVERVLRGLAKNIGTKVAGGIEFKITNEELANEANVTIFTVSRLLSEWHRMGLLVKGRGKVLLHSPEDLARKFASVDVGPAPKSTRNIAREQR